MFFNKNDTNWKNQLQKRSGRTKSNGLTGGEKRYIETKRLELRIKVNRKQIMEKDVLDRLGLQR